MPSIPPLTLSIKLLGDDSTVGATVFAGTAVEASARVDLVVAVALKNSAGGAAVCAGTAGKTSISNLAWHSCFLLDNS